MSSRRVYILTCDQAGCAAEYVGEITAGKSRQQAADLGWSHRIALRPAGPAWALDGCPDHDVTKIEAAT